VALDNVNGDSDTTFKKLKIIINEGATIVKPTSCKGCLLTDESKPISVTISL
jgi:hypothetical protein